MTRFSSRLLAYGLENIRFFIPVRPLRVFAPLGVAFTDSSDEEVIVECVISEERYKVSENYKITLVPVDHRFGKEHFYMSDLESLLEIPNSYRMITSVE